MKNIDQKLFLFSYSSTWTLTLYIAAEMPDQTVQTQSDYVIHCLPVESCIFTHLTNRICLHVRINMEGSQNVIT